MLGRKTVGNGGWKGSDVSKERRAGGMDPLVLLGGRPGQEGGVHSDGPYP